MFEWLKPKDSGAKSPLQKDISKNKAALIKEAMANARHARETIGEETLNRLVELMNNKKMAQEKPTSPADQAKKILREMDKGLLSDHLKDLMQNDRPPTKQ